MREAANSGSSRAPREAANAMWGAVYLLKEAVTAVRAASEAVGAGGKEITV
jgi:hypothetical protein